MLLLVSASSRVPQRSGLPAAGLLALALVASGPAGAAQDVYRCIERGRVTYQDFECPVHARQRVVAVERADAEDVAVSVGLPPTEVRERQGAVALTERGLPTPWRRAPAADYHPQANAVLGTPLGMLALMAAALLTAISLAVPRFDR